MNACPMCKYYDRPGFVINAWQIVPCFQCNPDNQLGLAIPRSIEETIEGQARDLKLKYPSMQADLTE